MRTLILGASLRGLADAARISLQEGEEVVMFDAERPDPPLDLTGRVDVLPTTWDPEFLSDIDRVVTSPWFPEVEPPISDALDKGIEVITEAGYGLEHVDIPFVAITGTNGKTTVTELVTKMLQASGVRALSGGNIGTPVSSAVQIEADLLVLELSSYQLRFLGDSIPLAAALLNIAPDHLDWHGTFDEYRDAKSRIFRGMHCDSVLAFDVHDAETATVVSNAQCTVVPCSGVDLPDAGNGVDLDYLVVGGDRFPAPTSDPTFRFDLVAAATVAMAVGGTREGVAAVIAGFHPGEHRRQVVPTSDGIVWVNDSKATNPHATTAAVEAFAPVVLLAGGQNKGLDLSPIAGLEGVSDLIAFGEAGPEIGASGGSHITVVATLEAAVARARAVAESGDTVLLSPGCASFDEFSSYADRGKAFQRLVKRSEGTAA